MEAGKIVMVDNSSLIAAYVWYPKSGALTIRLKDGSHYRYSDVDQKTFDDFEAAKSRGSFFARFIRGKFDSEKVENLGKFAQPADPAPWPFPTGLRPPEYIPNENFDEILEWSSEDEEEFFRTIDKDAM